MTTPFNPAPGSGPATAQTWPNQEPQQPSGKGKGGLIAALVAVTVLLGAGGWFAMTQLTDDGAAGDTAASEAFEDAGTPAEKVRTAVDRLMASGTMRASATSDGTTSTAQFDLEKRIVYSEMEMPPVGAVSVLLRDGVSYLRSAEGMPPEIEPNVWYRSSDDSLTAGMMGFDPKFFDAVISASPTVVETGTVDVAGTTAVKYAATVNKDALLDYMQGLVPEIADEPAARSAMAGFLPNTFEFSIDESGNVLQVNDGKTVTNFYDFGSPMDIPEIDMSTVREMPTS